MFECIIKIYKLINAYYYTHSTDETVWSKPYLFNYLTLKNSEVNIKNNAFMYFYHSIKTSL